MILFRNPWFVVVSCCLCESALALCTPPTTTTHGTIKNARQPTTGLNAVSGKGHKLSKPNLLMRGEYYKNENSTLPPPEIIAAKLGVKPTRRASNKTWKRAWIIGKRMIPVLHSTDSCKPPDSSLNLLCMWWKGLSGNDKSSPVCDDGLAYDLLPSGWRKIIKPRRLYPRLHHGNVELRTAYLDQHVTEIASALKLNESSSAPKIRLVCMGAGYDTRGIKMTERKIVDQVVELDLQHVVDAKERLFRRLVKRRPWLKDLSMPTLLPSDFNDLADVEEKLQSLLQSTDNNEWHTIFVFEGVMIYLDENVPSSLLSITSKLLRENNQNGSLCFADRLENVPGGDYDKGVIEMETNGWKLKDWSPKPGLAKHMGTASLISTKSIARNQLIL